MADTKALKKRIRELEGKVDYLEQILDSIPGHVYWKNQKGIYQGCNKTQLNALGLTREEFIGKTLPEIANRAPAETPAVHKLREENYIPTIDKIDKKVLRTKKDITVEENFTDANGRCTVFLTKKAPLKTKKGKAIGLVGLSVDIAEYKNPEFLSGVYFQNILDVLPENFYWVDKNGVVLGCNNNQAKLFGFNSSNEIVGKTIHDIAKKLGWSKEISTAVRNNDLMVMKTRNSIKAEETCILAGKLKTFLSYKHPLFNNKQEVVGLFGVTVDISDRKELENALRESKEKAEEISRMKSDFIHNMEHDIRTPFAGIYGMSAALARRETDPEKKECLELITESSKELLDYANYILAFAKIEEDYDKIILKEFSVNKLVQAVVRMEKPPAKIKGLELNCTISKNVPDIIIGDVTRFKGILINLISNAIKFTEKGQVSVNVELVSKTTEVVTLSFSVSDTGIGIPKDKQKNIYDKFFRINASNQGIYKGFGLGLQVVKKFVEELNGQLSLQSAPSEGTTFTFTLPFKLPVPSL